MPSASVTIATTVNARFVRNVRSAYRRSCQIELAMAAILLGRLRRRRERFIACCRKTVGSLVPDLQRWLFVATAAAVAVGSLRADTRSTLAERAARLTRET